MIIRYIVAIKRWSNKKSTEKFPGNSFTKIKGNTKYTMLIISRAFVRLLKPMAKNTEIKKIGNRGYKVSVDMPESGLAPFIIKNTPAANNKPTQIDVKMEK